MVIKKGAAAARCFFATGVCVLLLVCSQGCRDGAAKGVQNCLGVLVPSLFPFMAAAQLLTRSLPKGRKSRLISPSAKALIPVLIMSMLGGYPVGAAGISSLRSQGAIGEKEAERAALFMTGAGPGFAISFVGAAVLENQRAGSIIYLSQCLSVLITGLIALALPRPSEENYNSKCESKPPLPFDRALVESVYSASRSMIAICSFVVLFSALSGILEQLIADEAVLTALTAPLEVCSAVARLAKNGSAEQAAFAVGFGGLCVHLQIFAALKEIKVSKPLFFLFRIIQGTLTALLTHIGLRLIPAKTAVFSTAPSGKAVFFGGSVLSGVVLIGVMICFLISVKQIKTNC